MKKLLILLHFLLVVICAHAQNDTSYKKEVAAFIDLIKLKLWTKLSAKTNYPLDRQYPLPSVRNKEEFMKRHDEIFDETLIKAIVNSNVDKDWETVGWRGVMLQNGILWVSDYDGKLIAVNYQSPIEKKKRQELIGKDRAALYPPLRNYAEPTCLLTTAKFRIRIDKMADDTYRYASWPVKISMSDKPNLVIEKGTVEFDGTGGNHTYHFKNNGYTYDCDIIVMGEDDSPPAALNISKGDKTILSQRATLLGD